MVFGQKLLKGCNNFIQSLQKVKHNRTQAKVKFRGHPQTIICELCPFSTKVYGNARAILAFCV